MNRKKSASALVCGFVLCVGLGLSAQTSSGVGIFESHADVGTVLHPGSVDYDKAHQTYTMSGSGENMWLATDAFQFAWKKISGDVTLTADISFLTTTGNEHKKAVLMLRQNLDADSIYADVALHASGMTALQFRDEKSGLTQEVVSNISAPKRLSIVKRGDYVYMALAAYGGEPQVAGGCITRRRSSHRAPRMQSERGPPRRRPQRCTGARHRSRRDRARRGVLGTSTRSRPDCGRRTHSQAC